MVEVEWLRARSFRYSCLVRVAIAANFSERSAAISPFMAAVKESAQFHVIYRQTPVIPSQYTTLSQYKNRNRSSHIKDTSEVTFA